MGFDFPSKYGAVVDLGKNVSVVEPNPPPACKVVVFQFESDTTAPPCSEAAMRPSRRRRVGLFQGDVTTFELSSPLP